MVQTCCVYKCHNRLLKSNSRFVSYFRFPKDKRKRAAWIKAVNRQDFVPNDQTRVCSDHFRSGWHTDDPSDPDYAPNVFTYKAEKVDPERSERANKRQEYKVSFLLIQFFKYVKIFLFECISCMHRVYGWLLNAVRWLGGGGDLTSIIKSQFIVTPRRWRVFCRKICKKTR